MITGVVAQTVQRVESRKEVVGRSMEHIRHMIAGEDWALAKEYANELISLLDEQMLDSAFVSDSMVEEE